MGYDPDRALLADAGVKVDVLDSGCCGLAGTFGFETGHYDASMVCAERVLLPAVRSAAEETPVLADGFSCRTQSEQSGSGRVPVYLAELLDRRADRRGGGRPHCRNHRLPQQH
jgi:Fe-S oxidoreductase